MFGRIESA